MRRSAPMPREVSMAEFIDLRSDTVTRPSPGMRRAMAEAPIGRGGLFTAAEFRSAIKPRGHIVLPPTGLVAIENTHNLGGGVVWRQSEVEAICAAAREAHITCYLDGARLFNAAAASDSSLA